MAASGLMAACRNSGGGVVILGEDWNVVVRENCGLALPSPQLRSFETTGNQ
jgi:hypothetical protein